MLETFYMYIRGFLYAKSFFIYVFTNTNFLKNTCAKTFLKKKINDGAIETISITDTGLDKNAILLFFFLKQTQESPEILDFSSYFAVFFLLNRHGSLQRCLTLSLCKHFW